MEKFRLAYIAVGLVLSVSVQICAAIPIQSKDELLVANNNELDVTNKYYLPQKLVNSDSGDIEFRIPFIHFPGGRFRQHSGRIFFPDDFEVRPKNIGPVYRSAVLISQTTTPPALMDTTDDANLDASMPGFFPVAVTQMTTITESETIGHNSRAQKFDDKSPIIFETSAEVDVGSSDSDSQMTNPEIPEASPSLSLSDRDALEIKKLRAKLAQLEKLHREKEEAYKFAYWSLFQTPNVGCPSGTRKDHSGRCVKPGSSQIANARYST